MAADECGRAVRIIIGPGQESDYSRAAALIEGIKTEALIADKGYDADWLIDKAKAQGIKEVVIPSRSKRKRTQELTTKRYAGKETV